MVTQIKGNVPDLLLLLILEFPQPNGMMKADCIIWEQDILFDVAISTVASKLGLGWGADVVEEAINATTDVKIDSAGNLIYTNVFQSPESKYKKSENDAALDFSINLMKIMGKESFNLGGKNSKRDLTIDIISDQYLFQGHKALDTTQRR